MNTPSYFNSKVVWITGASSGIGEELCYRLSGTVSKLVISSRRVEELNRVKEACQDPENVIVQPLDLERSDEFSSIVSAITEKTGTVDILFNNGGISQRGTAKETDQSVSRKIMEINFFGNTALSQAVIPLMIENGGGHIVVTSSVAGKFGFFQRTSYAASKHALHGYYDSLRLEHYDDNIKVTLLCPGAVKTNMSVNALTGSGEKHAVLDKMQDRGVPVEKCVQDILKGVARQREEMIFGGRETIPVHIKRWFPRLLTRILSKQKPTG